MSEPSPKPGAWIKPTKVEQKPPVVKRPFVRPEHLTSRPFRDDEKLHQLKRDLSKHEITPPKRRRPKPNSK